MSHTGEFELIERISAAASVPAGVTGIGDDCAIIPQREGLDTLVTTDLLIEGRHFLLEDVRPFDLGWKSAAVNISDIAAMGGRPAGAFLSIALPKKLTEKTEDSKKTEEVKDKNPDRSENGKSIREGAGDERYLKGQEVGKHTEEEVSWTDEFIKGFLELAGRFGVALLGGDTSASDDKLFINVTVLGECPHGRALTRSAARPGDTVYVTGPLGDSAAGLKLVLERSSKGVENKPNNQHNTLIDSKIEDGFTQNGRTADEQTYNKKVKVNNKNVIITHYPQKVHIAGNTDNHCNEKTSEDKSVMGNNPDIEPILINRHYRPVPRVETGLKLAATPGVHAMMDISDGIASDLRHILKASEDALSSPETKISLGAEIDLGKLPLSRELKQICSLRGWEAAELAVSGGEDYELLFTASPEAKLPEGCTAIGRITDKGGIRWIGGEKSEYKGFTHF